jgi:hypothetical protein
MEIISGYHIQIVIRTNNAKWETFFYAINLETIIMINKYCNVDTKS